MGIAGKSNNGRIKSKLTADPRGRAGRGGVEKLNGEDPVAYIISMQARRDLSVGQRAIWTAKAFPDDMRGKAAHRGKRSPNSGTFPMVNSQRLSEARTVLQYAPDLAEQVQQAKGEVSFAKAFEEAKRRKAEANSPPDLAR